MSYDAVLFDCDGVLVDLPDQRTLYKAATRTFARFDLGTPSTEAVRDLVGGNVEGIASFCRQAEIDRGAYCATAAREVVQAQCAEFEAGLRSLYDDVAAVRSLDAVCGVVSDNHRRVLTYLIERFDLSDRFRTVHGCSLTPAGFARRKPNPYNIEAALTAIDTEPETALYVGDRGIDVEAADRAGVDSVLVCRDDDDLPDVTPTHRVESLRELPRIVA